MDTDTLLAGGGVSGGIIAIVLLLYRVFLSKKSKCHTEIGGITLDVSTTPESTNEKPIITIDNPLPHEGRISGKHDAVGE